MVIALGEVRSVNYYFQKSEQVKTVDEARASHLSSKRKAKRFYRDEVISTNATPAMRELYEDKLEKLIEGEFSIFQ